MMESSDNPQLAVVIVNYNTREDLRTCLSSLGASPLEMAHEIIVVDNASTDGSVDMIRETFPTVRVIINQKNVGLVKGYNQACRTTKAPYVLLLDSDTIVHEHAVERLYRFLLDHPTVGIVAPQLLNVDGTNQLTARNLPSAMNGLFGRQTLLTQWFPNNPWSRHYLRRQDTVRETSYDVEWISFACGMFRGDLLSKVGQFDEDYFVYWIDADWCRRVLKAGFCVSCVPTARVTHVEKNKKGRRKRPRAIIDFHRGAYLYFRKHHTPSKWSPMRWVAMCGLSLRAGLHLALNHFKR